MALDIGKVIGVFQRMDPETVRLFMTFLDQAKESSDLNQFLKDALRKVTVMPTVIVERK